MISNEIVKEELQKLARGILPMMLLTGGILVLCGQASVRMLWSLLLGSAYALTLFALMGSNVARSVLLPPGKAEASLQRGYVFRYCLTGAFIIFMLKHPLFHPWAAILPLFFPKLVLLAGSIFQKKGGK